RELAAGGWPAGIHDGGAELSGLAEGCPVPDRSVLKGRPYSPINTVIANHGCPNRCSFCAISRIADYRQRPIESVIDELRGLGRRNLIFYDPNFFADRAYALELMKAMEPLRLRWGATATVDFGFDDELLDAAQRAGLSGVLIGFESMSRQALESANKRFAEPGSYRQAVLNIHRRRITINGSFVLGLDEDSAEDLAILPDRILEMGIDLPLFFLLTPIPGSGLFEELKQQGRILTEDWSRYTQADVVFSPLGMTAGQLQDSYSLAWRRSYSFRNILRRVFNTPGTSAYHKFIVLCMNVGFKFLGRDRAVA
ncbi:MAG: radical SAM protein, partial [Coriobacteriia bacterium]|nr:radical SAM protein [Coriobacteriia bacterium]